MGTTLPGGLKPNTDYFVIGASGSTCQLSATSGGAAVTIANDCTGYIGLDLTGFETLRQAIKLLVGHWYIHRAAVTNDDAWMQLPLAVESLVASQHA
jgi:hypothetical protein